MPSIVLAARNVREDSEDVKAVPSAILASRGHMWTKEIMQKCPRQFWPPERQKRIMEMLNVAILVDLGDAKEVPSVVLTARKVQEESEDVIAVPSETLVVK